MGCIRAGLEEAAPFPENNRLELEKNRCVSLTKALKKLGHWLFIKMLIESQCMASIHYIVIELALWTNRKAYGLRPCRSNFKFLLPEKQAAYVQMGS